MSEADHLTRLQEQLEEILSRPLLRNHIAQSHSRAVLRRVSADESSWPGYRFRDEELLHVAHRVMFGSLRLREDPERLERSDEYLVAAAEILEFLYGDIDQHTDETLRQLFNAALAYYVAGQYARAYVLTKELPDELPPELELLRLVFLKRFEIARQLITQFLQPRYLDGTHIAHRVDDGSLTEDQALDDILTSSFFRLFSFMLEHPKTGIESLLDQAREVADAAVEVSKFANFVDWWWLFYCARHLLDEYDNNSLWHLLGPWSGDDPSDHYVRPYILSNFVRTPPVVELWRSQTHALPTIIQDERPSFCLKMPTSAGKTRIAELTILRFLLDFQADDTRKCVYVAPYRSLAVEIEKSLQRTFGALGVKVSEIYGGYELSPAERLVLERTRVLVATPEKVDAFLRFNPDFAEQIRLVVIDEGHIISLSERGLYFELFVHRIVRRLRQAARIVYVSAVLPNMDDIAEWVTGDPGNVVERDWRPSRLLVGELRWEQNRARIEYQQSNRQPLGHTCFVPRFVEQIDPKLFAATRKRRLFPSSAREAVAASAIKLSSNGPVMVFCSQERFVNAVTRDIMKGLELYSAQAAERGEEFALVRDARAQIRINAAATRIEEYVGNDSKVLTFLRAGIVAHSGSVPQPARIELEELVRDGVVNIVVATTTLAQGVNLPIRHVIVYGLYHHQNAPLETSTFWNICGRAGRALQENEGQILFTVDTNKSTYQLEREESIRTAIVSQSNEADLVSALARVLQLIFNIWQSRYPYVDATHLFEYLAENHLLWAGEQEEEASDWLEQLDTLLLAVFEESEIEAITPEVVQTLFSDSLAFLQASKLDESGNSSWLFQNIIYSRGSYVWNRLETDNQRKRFYQLGFRIPDCERIENNSDLLLAHILHASMFDEWDLDQKTEFMAFLCDELIKLDALHPKANNVALYVSSFDQILKFWLGGLNANEIAASNRVDAESPTQVSQLLEDVVRYKLPWGFNSLVSYLKLILEERDTELPVACEYLSSMLKFGVSSPTAVCLVTFGITNRRLANELAEAYPHDFQSADDVLPWLLGLDSAELLGRGFAVDDIEIIRAAQARLEDTGQRSAGVRHELSFVLGEEVDQEIVQVGEILTLDTLTMRDEGIAILKTLWGNDVFRLGKVDVGLLNLDTNSAIVWVEAVQQQYDGVRVVVSILEL